jgi:hypothetical protein
MWWNRTSLALNVGFNYVPKPDRLLKVLKQEPAFHWNLQIIVIQARSLSSRANGTINPTIFLQNTGWDSCQKRTSSWPELDHIEFYLFDADVGSDERLRDAAVPCIRLKNGYRAVELSDKNGRMLVKSFVLPKISITCMPD